MSSSLIKAWQSFRVDLNCFIRDGVTAKVDEQWYCWQEIQWTRKIANEREPKQIKKCRKL